MSVPLSWQQQQTLQRHVTTVHSLGARPVYEALIEIGSRFGDIDAVIEVMADFAAIDPELCRAVGGDKFPPRPLHLAGGAA